MNYVAIFSDDALKELSESWLQYENTLPGLGDRFKHEVFNKIYKIENDPSKELQRKPPYREAMVNTFPFLIIYRIDEMNKMVFISSIFHTRRNPKKKYRK